MKESQIREHIEKGWIRAIVTFEVVGKPAKHVEEALKSYLDNIKKDERIIVLKEDVEKAEKMEDDLYSAFAETDALFKNLETLTWISINFGPASIEITAPDDIDVTARDLTNWLNDLLANLHEISASLRGSRNSTEHLTIAMNQLIINTILLSTQQGPKTAQEISESTGIIANQIDPFLQHLTEKGRLSLTEGKYVYVPVGAVHMKQPNVSIHMGSPDTKGKTQKKKKR